MPENIRQFDPDCRRCPRLVEFLAESKDRFPDYHCAPVAPFGAARAVLLVVGLAPGMHGANATGRPFTGDYAGVLLYRTLHEFGFGSAPESVSRDDGLRLRNCRITNAVKCVPPANKPETSEVNACNAFLVEELAGQAPGSVVLALGGIAHKAVLKAMGLKQSACRFAHRARHELPGGLILVDSYHCSRYNTQTRRLTDDMFRAVFRDIASLLDAGK